MYGYFDHWWAHVVRVRALARVSSCSGPLHHFHFATSVSSGPVRQNKYKTCVTERPVNCHPACLRRVCSVISPHRAARVLGGLARGRGCGKIGRKSKALSNPSGMWEFWGGLAVRKGEGEILNSSWIRDRSVLIWPADLFHIKLLIGGVCATARMYHAVSTWREKHLVHTHTAPTLLSKPAKGTH